jgi:hypothetical protein
MTILEIRLEEVFSTHKLFEKRQGLIPVSVYIRDSTFWTLGRIEGSGGLDIVYCVFGNHISSTLSCVISSFDTSRAALAQLLTCGSCPHEEYRDDPTRELFEISYWAAEPLRNIFVLRLVVRRSLHVEA